ncbi:MAG: hypothetical protein KF819_36210 [Labilithrix sp.]|nr:hypothetical protein [Labilithrix sp.]
MHVRLYRPAGPDRVAFVSELPASGGDGLLVQVARGPTRDKLGAPKLLGPMTREVADQIFAREVEALRAEGFVRSGLADLLLRLDSKRRSRRALAARRLGWLRERAAVEPLLALAAKANEELPVVVDALGEIGDPLAIPVARAAAERKLLSRRRSGVEALRKLADLEGISDARTRALERIPASVQAVLASVDAGTADATALAIALGEVPVKDRGLAIDSVYELGLDTCAAAVRHALTQLADTPLEAPHVWRYTKSVFKRAMLRHDGPTFGVLAHAIERKVGRVSGETSTVKSGLDGQMKSVRIFGAKTQRYVARLSWRHLRMLGRYRPDLYAMTAAEVLTHYTDDDAQTPHGLYGSYARCYLLGRILYGSSTRFVLDHRTLRFRLKSASVSKPPPNAREEAFPELWDRAPLAYVRALAGAKLVLVQELAYAALVARHEAALREAPHAWVVQMLGAPYPPTVELGLAELRRRFDPHGPDWSLVIAVLHDERALVRDLGLEWIGLTLPLWTLTPHRVVQLLSGGDGTARSAVAAHVVSALAIASPDARRAMALAILDALRAPEPAEGAHDPYGAIARALGTEIAANASASDLLGMLGAASAAARAAAASALAVHPDVDAIIGPAELAFLGSHAQVALREAARALLRRRSPALRSDPSSLFDLLDSEWPDMRAFAAELLGAVVDASTLSVDAVVGIVDSTYPDVQDLGKALIARRIADLPTSELLAKLLEHPHPNMRRFVLDLVVAHLKEGFVALASTEEMFRAIFLDTSPDRSLKRDAIAFLEKRGCVDERQAEIALRLLVEVVKSKTVFDFDLALGAITTIKFTQLTSDVTEASAPLSIDEET